MRRIIISILAVMMLSATAFCADLNITEGPDCDVETITFEVPEGVSKGWFPLEKVAKYLPIKVTQDAKNSKYVVESEPMAKSWPMLAQQEITVSSLKWRTRDLKMVDGVLYCSPWFLANRLGGVGFVHEGELWFCDTTLDLDGHIKASMLELQVVAPEEYAFATKYLTGGIKAAEEDVADALAYIHPYAAKPVCYISNTKMTGATLASSIAHEAYHAYQAKNGLAISEQGAETYEKDVLNLLLKEQRVHNGTIHLYQ